MTCDIKIGVGWLDSSACVLKQGVELIKHDHYKAMAPTICRNPRGTLLRWKTYKSQMFRFTAKG